MRLTSRYRFSASHRLDAPSLTAEENRRLYGKCNNPHGHGHDYAVEITVEGPLDASGQVVNRMALDTLVKDQALARMDHRYLNMDLAEFADCVPTTENLAIAIWQRLAPKLKAAQLHRVRVYETPDLFVDFYGEA